MDKLSSENKFAVMPEWVIELAISHTAFRLYAVLARYADNVTHQAFPSLETLAGRLGCGEKTVRRAIEDLVAYGAIKKHSRGRYQSSLYTVMTSPPKGSKMSGDGSKMSHEGSNLSTRSVKNVQVTRTTELEPKNVEPLNSAIEQFWAIYPRRTAKGRVPDALRKALKKATIEKIVAGAERYRDDPNREDAFTQYPATWLNAEGWDDDPLPGRVTMGVRKLTNAEEGALLVAKYRAEEQQALESGHRLQVEGGENE